MSAPPVPPRPNDLSHSYGTYSQRQDSLPPPVPPLPPDLRPQDRSPPPHYAYPLAAPRPQKLDPALPANMARDLDDQVAAGADYGGRFPAINHTPGFAIQTSTPWQSTWDPAYPTHVTYSSPPPIVQPYTRSYQPPSDTPHTIPQPHPPSASPYPPKPDPTRVSSAVPALTAPLPTVASLSASLSAIQHPHHDPASKVAWCRDVITLVNRSQQPDSTTDPPVGPARITDPQLLHLAQIAVPLIVQISSTQPLPSPTPPYLAEAIFLRGTFAASGAYPEHVRHSPRAAFKDFEAARGAYPAAWFRLGRDYENFNDNTRAKNCFERGAKLGVESCIYRMGMAHLMGQLGLPAKPELAVPLLHRAATLATIDAPQPAYVFGLLLLAEFSHVSIPPHFFTPVIPPGSSTFQEARKHLERATYLNFAPAQYKLGHAYEFAQPPFPFEPLMSVQYYSLASQQGESEADMALSKWFLCGAEGAFEKDEGLAWTFADKAARKGLPSAEFAMGYYAEVGVGGPKDIDAARRWYHRASEHGNSDAADRLSALSQPAPQSLSRKEHDSITESKLVRTRTQAKQRSDSIKGPSGLGPRGDGRLIVDVIRKNSLAVHGGAYSGPPPLGPTDPNQGAVPPLQAQRPDTSANTRLQPPPGPSQSNRVSEYYAQAQRLTGISSPDISSVNTSPRLQPAQPGGRPPNRYTLSDPGAVPTSAGAPSSARVPSPPALKYPARGQSPAGRQGQNNTKYPGGTPPQDEPFTAPVPAQGKKPGPTTFAEMGFSGAKAQDKECIIM